MRTTNEIIIAVQEAEPATEEELRLAIAAIVGMEHFLEDNLRKLIEAIEKGTTPLQTAIRVDSAKRILETLFNARKKTPAEWLGPGNIPGTPENIERRRLAKAIFKKATGVDLDAEGSPS